jgi:anti-sigma factor RsiW
MNEKILELLYRSLDGQLTPDERKILRDALAGSEELRQERGRIMAVRKMVSASGAESFRPFFAERVMRQVKSLGEGEAGGWTLQEWLSRVFRRVVIAGTVVAVCLVVVNLVQTEDVSVAAAFGMPEVSIEEMLELPVDSILEGRS